jgi:hypothetical protein
MLRRAFLALLTGGIAAAECGTGVASPRFHIRVIDAMPTFWKFWDTTIREPDDKRVRAFFDTVVAGYPDLFHHGLIAGGALTDLGAVPEAQLRVAAYLHDVSPYIPAMRHMTDTIRDNFLRYAGEFPSLFPDYAPTTPVYFSVSLFGYDGGFRGSGEDAGLYLGIDALARLFGTAGNLKVILQHELFHQYHHQIAPEIIDDRAAWAYMWEEGLATYVSRRMSPGVTADQALMIPARLTELAGPHLSALARQLLDIADSTDPNDYRDLFSPDIIRAGFPARSGYYLGYRVAEQLAATRSLAQLAHLRGVELRGAVSDTLTGFSNRH